MFPKQYVWMIRCYIRLPVLCINSTMFVSVANVVSSSINESRFSVFRKGGFFVVRPFCDYD